MRIVSSPFFLLLFFVGASLETVFSIKGTVSCQTKSEKWCYTIDLLELDDNVISHDRVAQVYRCRSGSVTESFRLEGYETWDGLFDENYEVGVWVRHNCASQNMGYMGSLGQVQMNQKFWRQDVRIDMNAHTIEHRNYSGYYTRGKHNNEN